MKIKRLCLLLTVGLVVVAALFLAGNAVSTYALDENDCLSCHGNPDLTKTNGEGENSISVC